MKKVIFISILLCVKIYLNCQEWQSSSIINGTGIEPKYSTIDPQGNIYILSQFIGTISNPSLSSFGSADLFVCKLNSDGLLLWYDHIGSSGGDLPGGLTLNNGYLYVTGAYPATCNFNKGTVQLGNTGNGDIFLAKYDFDGQFQFAKRIGSHPTNQASTHLKADNNNHFIVTGYFRDSVLIGNTPTDQVTLKGTVGVASNFIACLDVDGNCIWAKRYLGTNTLTRFQRIDISENGYYFGGYFQGSLTLDVGTINSYVPTTYDAFLYKTDFEGNGQWVRRIRGQSTENFRTLTTDEFDNVYVLGNYNSSTLYIDSTDTQFKTYDGNSGGYDTYLAKYNRSGILQWFLTKGSSARDIYNDFVIRNNIIYATGYFANQIIFNNDTLRTDDPLNEDAFLAAFNQIGDPISGISIKGNGNYNDAGTIVKMDANSRAYVAGYFKSPQIQIGSQIYTSGDVNISDQFFAVYKQAFKAVITDENMVSCNGLSDGMLTVTPYFGRPPYTYSWSHNPSLNNPMAENLAAGDYTVTITDANDSITSITGHITQAPVLDVTAVVLPVSCNNGNNGEIDITPVGGSGNFSFFWTSVDGSGIQPLDQDQTGLSKGTYSVKVVDVQGCKDSADFIVTEPQPITYSGTVITNIELPPGNNGAINLNPSGGNYPLTFVWTGPNAFAAYSEDIGALGDAGLYKVSITDARNCLSDTTFLVDDSSTFMVQVAAKSDVLCYGADNGSVTIRMTNGTPPYSYQWSDAVTLYDSVRTGMRPDHYTVTVTDGLMLTSQVNVDINSPAAALTLLLDAENLMCHADNSGVLDLAVSGGTLPYLFSWSNGYNGEDLVNIQADNYTVNVTDGNGCTAQSTKEITQPDALVVNIEPLNGILCNGDRTAIAKANATGGTPPGSYSYLWDDPGTQTTQTAYDLEAGTYNVTVTDSNECRKSASVTILEPEALTVDILQNSPSCAGLEDGSIIPTPHGGTGTGYEYIWSNNVYQRFNTDIPAGIYVLTLNDNNNCTLVDTIDLADPDSVKISLVEATDVSCLGKTDGTINITAAGGVGVLEYSADNGQNYGASPAITALDAGAYTVIVKDENDCLSEVIPLTLTVEDTVDIADISSVNPVCFGLDNGSVSIIGSGGTGTYEYSVDEGATFVNTSLIEDLSAGNYRVMVRDENDCRSPFTPVDLVYEDTLTILVESTDLTCSGLPDGTITITVLGGNTPYEYSADGGATFLTDTVIRSLAQGDYNVVVRDANGCLSEESNITLNITDVCGLIIYDGFSPNNDGKNEVWNIGNAGSFPKIKVKIFNLWGKMIFSSTGYGTPWDGTYEGNDLPSGTYYYVIDPGDGSEVITGDVSIVK